MSTVFKVQVILICHLSLTLSSSVFPKLLIISVYVMNFNSFIFCELVLFSLQPLICASSCKRIVFKERDVWDEGSSIRFNQKILPFLPYVNCASLLLLEALY